VECGISHFFDSIDRSGRRSVRRLGSAPAAAASAVKKDGASETEEGDDDPGDEQHRGPRGLAAHRLLGGFVHRRAAQGQRLVAGGAARSLGPRRRVVRVRRAPAKITGENLM